MDFDKEINLIAKKMIGFEVYDSSGKSIDLNASNTVRELSWVNGI